MCESDTLPTSHARLLLDYGLDEQTGEDGLIVDERGMRFVSRWEFSLGTRLAIACEYEHPRLGRVKVPIEGLVVWCERAMRMAGPVFDTTVLFLEIPDELRQSVRDFSLRLAAAG